MAEDAIESIIPDDPDAESRALAALEQQRRLEETLRRAHAAQLEAIAAMEEMRRLMSHPFVSSVAIEDDGGE